MNETLTVFLVIFGYGMASLILLGLCNLIVNHIYKDQLKYKYNSQQTIAVNNKFNKTA